MTEIAKRFDAEVAKVDQKLGIVFGWAVVCRKNGREYFDSQGDHIPEAAMLEAAAEFMSTSRSAREMHRGAEIGKVAFAFPLTTDLLAALGIESDKTGLMVGVKPNDPKVLGKFLDGTYSGFSIGGSVLESEAAA